MRNSYENKTVLLQECDQATQRQKKIVTRQGRNYESNIRSNVGLQKDIQNAFKQTALGGRSNFSFDICLPFRPPIASTAVSFYKT